MRWIQALALHPGSTTGFNWEEVEDTMFSLPGEGQGAGRDINILKLSLVFENFFEEGN